MTSQTSRQPSGSGRGTAGVLGDLGDLAAGDLVARVNPSGSGRGTAGVLGDLGDLAAGDLVAGDLARFSAVDEEPAAFLPCSVAAAEAGDGDGDRLRVFLGASESFGVTAADDTVLRDATIARLPHARSGCWRRWEKAAAGGNAASSTASSRVVGTPDSRRL